MIVLALVHPPAWAVDRHWNTGSGLWTQSANWTGSTVPQPADNAFVDSIFGLARLTTNQVPAVTSATVMNSATVTFSGVGLDAGSLLVGTDFVLGRSETHGALNVQSNSPFVVFTGGMTVVGNLRLGVLSGVGTVNQNAGSVIVGEDVILGDTRLTGSFNARGAYNLSGSGLLRMTDLEVGSRTGTQGTFNLSGGVIDVRGNLRVGGSGIGAFNQTGGTVTPDFLFIGSSLVTPPAGTTSYNFSGGSLDSGFTDVRTNAVFNHTGGTPWLGHLHMYSNGRINVSTGPSKVLQSYTLHFYSDQSVIELNNNTLEVYFSGLEQRDELTDALRRGYNGGAWTGGGITSSTAASLAASAHPTGVGLVPFDNTGFRMRNTLYGDADLDGDVDLEDVGTWSVNFTGELAGTGPKYWYQGDWDYDGDVDLDDVGWWSRNFTGELGGGAATSQLVLDAPIHPMAAGALQSVGITIVPEPTGALAVSSAGLLSLRRLGRQRSRAIS
jgi:hypothetical protein